MAEGTSAFKSAHFIGIGGAGMSGIALVLHERGCKVTGATAFFADIDGNIGPIIAQQAIDINPDDTLQSLNQRIMEEAAWKLLPKAVALFCQNRLEIHGERVIIRDARN